MFATFIPSLSQIFVAAIYKIRAHLLVIEFNIAIEKSRYGVKIHIGFFT